MFLVDLSKSVGLLSDVQAAEDESVFLLHACAHNPTGIDPTQDQWAELSKLMKSKKHTAFFDCAYQVTAGIFYLSYRVSNYNDSLLLSWAMSRYDRVVLKVLSPSVRVLACYRTS